MAQGVKLTAQMKSTATAIAGAVAAGVQERGLILSDQLEWNVWLTAMRLASMQETAFRLFEENKELSTSGAKDAIFLLQELVKNEKQKAELAAAEAAAAQSAGVTEPAP